MAARGVWATGAGIATFLAVLVLGVPLAYFGFSHTLFTKTTFPGNVPPERFIVAYRELTDSGTRGPTRLDWWKRIEEERRKGRRLTFLVPAPTAMQGYSILDDRGTSQIIETDTAIPMGHGRGTRLGATTSCRSRTERMVRTRIAARTAA